MAQRKDRIIIFDTTLRDGEQCPGASMNLREKLEVARQLARLGVDVIEAGFPIASPGDFEAVRAIASQVNGPVIAGLARCTPKDIDRAAEAVEPAARKRIHVFLATSEIHRQHKLKKAKDEIIRLAADGVKRARRSTEDIEFSPEDASRTEPDFLADVVRAVLDAGATTINIPDTVGYTVPSEFGALIRYLFDHVEELDRAVVSVHCHNDLGLAVANSLAAVREGARQIECTINGLGERAGNASLEEIVMALRVRRDAFPGVTTGIKTRQILRTSRLVSRVTGMLVQRNKAIVGSNAFAHEAGIHQDGMLKERTTYEIMKPQDVGWSESELVLGKHSGRHAFRTRLHKLGYDLDEQHLAHAFQRFKELADKKKTVYDDDILAIVDEELSAIPEVYELDYIHVTSGNRTLPTATLRIRKGKEILQDAACGDGPVDAALKTIDRITRVGGRLLEYNLQALSGGKDAMGEVTVRIGFEREVVVGRGSSTDIIEASAKAYLNGLNRLLYMRGQQGRKVAAGATP